MEQTRRHSDNITLNNGESFEYGHLAACSGCIILPLTVSVGPVPSIELHGSVDGSHFERVAGPILLVAGVPVGIQNAGLYKVMRIEMLDNVATFVVSSYWS